MLETLNIMEGFDRTPAVQFGRIHPPHRGSAEAGLRGSRHLLRRSQVQSQIPADVLLSKEYAAERRKQITERASLDFLPGKINGKIGQHPALKRTWRSIKIDDVLMAHDTTCVDAIDDDGMVFSATPSGAWMPSVIAGDTGIPLTQRAQSFVLVPGNPNELAGGKRPRVTLSPTLVTHARRQAVHGAFDSRRRRSGAGADPDLVRTCSITG